MHRFASVLLCAVCVFTAAARGQRMKIVALHAPLGTVLTFHLQTRMNPAAPNEMDELPRGTEIRVKMLSGVDSGMDRDGSPFHGEVVEAVYAGSKVIVHPDSEVHGILVLLRSRNHPEGFRYELLVTRVTDHAKTYDLTASLNPSFVDAGAPAPAASKPEEPIDRKANDAASANLPSSLHN
jgi:hypothetical protein